MPRLLQAAIAAIVVSASLAHAQDDSVPLGDLARAVRKAKPTGEPEVIDNDNFHLMMDKAESARLKGEPVFAVSNAGKTFTAISPDGICSLSFDARTIERMPFPYIATELPAQELWKLDGPASIANGVLEVSLHNGTRWQLKEITVGIAPLAPRNDSAANPAENASPQPEATPTAASRLPERSFIYHLKGSGAPDSTTVFQAVLDPASTQATDWQWTIVAARGIPPAPGAPREPQLEMSSPVTHAGAASSEPVPAPGPPAPPTDGGSTQPEASPDPQP
jgi:hypothetical protein